jgi:hypothetical protein
MRTKFLLLVLSAALITSCSTYRAGQTPDDVYYSPAKEYVAKQEKEVRRDRYEENISAEDDRYLRMKIQNRERWSTIDDFDYWNNPYNSRFYSYSPYSHFTPYNHVYLSYNGPTWNRWGLNNFNDFGWNNYGWNRNNWNGNYNYLGYGGYGYGGGYYQNVIIKNPVRTTSNVGRPSLGGYRNNGYSNSNRGTLGETLGKIFSSSGSSVNSGYSNTNSSRSSSYEPPSRSYNPPASTQSSSSSSSSSGSTGTTRPPR